MVTVILQGACVAVAALIQYFLVAAFCWMLIEGIYLYLFVVKVYNVSNKVNICHGFSWGKFNCGLEFFKIKVEFNLLAR